jgi:hypothetical protein
MLSVVLINKSRPELLVIIFAMPTVHSRAAKMPERPHGSLPGTMYRVDRAGPLR